MAVKVRMGEKEILHSMKQAVVMLMMAQDEDEEDSDDGEEDGDDDDDDEEDQDDMRGDGECANSVEDQYQLDLLNIG